MVTGEELIQRKVLLPAERENIWVNVAAENIEICACDFQELRENEKRGGARVFLFLPVDCRPDNSELCCAYVVTEMFVNASYLINVIKTKIPILVLS